MNPVYLILLLSLAGGYAAHALTTKRTADRTEIKILNLIGVKVFGTELEFILDVAADNYSNNSITIDDPVIRIYLDSPSPAVTSKPSEKKYTLGKKSRTRLTLRLRAGLTALPDLFKVVFGGQSSGKEIKIEVTTKAKGLPPITDHKTYKINDLVKLFQK